MKTTSPILSDDNFLNNIQNLSQTINEGVVITDAKENIVWVNPAFEKICGYSLKKLIGKKPDILQGIGTDKNTVQAIRKRIAERKIVDVEILNYKPDKTPYWVKLNITPVFNKQKKLTNFIAFEHDITDQKTKILAIEVADVLYKTLFDKNPTLMFIFDKHNYKILEANDAALNFYGYTREEFLKLTIKDIRPKEDWENVKKILPKVKNNFVLQGVWRHCKKNKEIIYVEIKATQIEFKGKNAILVIPTDMTERIKKEDEIQNLYSNLVSLNKELTQNLHEKETLNRELKIKEQKLKTAQGTAKIATWEIKVKNNLITCSEELYKLFEIPLNKKLDFKVFEKKIHKDDLERYVKNIDAVVKNHTPLNIEYKIKLSGGRHRHLVTQGALILDEKGKPDVISGITIDITAKKNAAELIENQLKNINIILSNISEPFYIIDRKYNLLFINDASLKLSGYKKEQVIGKNIWDLYPGRDFRQEKKEYAKALKENETHQFETEYNGRTFSINLYPSEIGLAVSARDITEKKRREIEIIEQAKFIKEISDNTPGGIVQTIYHPDNKVEIAFLSAGFEEIWGVSIEEVYADPSIRFKVIHPDDVEEVKRGVENSLKNLVELNHKFRYVNRKTKEVKWVRAKAVTTKREDGCIVLNGVFVDITESENNLNELVKSNERYDYISKAAQEGIWDWDLATDIITIGGTYPEMMKAPVRIPKITKEQFLEVIHKDDKERVLKSLEDYLTDSSKILWEDTFRIVNFAGEVLSVYGRASVVYDEFKKPVRIVGSTVNVTEKVKAEVELKDKAKFIEEIGDNIPGALFKEVIYPDGRLDILFLSDGFEKFWGVPVEDLIKAPHLKINFIHPDDLERVKDTVRNLKHNSKISDKIRYINKRTDEIFWVSINAIAKDNGDGGIVLTGVVIDISDTEKYYNELEKSNRRYEYVSKAANETIWEWDLKNNTMELSGNYEKMFGYKFPNNIVDFSFVLSRIHPEDIPIVQENIQEGLTDYENHFRENYYRMLRADNSVMYVYERSYTLFDPVTKEPLKLIGTTQDITLRKKHEEEIKQKEKFIHEVGDNIPGALFETLFYKEGSYKHLYLSVGFEKFWGVPVDEVINTNFSECSFLHPDDEKVIADMIEHFEDNQKVNVKYRYVNSVTQEVFWVSLNAIAHLTVEGDYLLTGVIIDISDTEKYYSQLEKSNERYELISKAANEGIWDWDLVTNKIIIGGNFNKMMKSDFDLEEITFDMFKGTIHPDDLPRVEKKVDEILADPTQRYWEDTFRLLNSEGEIVNVYERGYIIYDEVLNKPVRFVGSAVDITQKVKDEHAIKEKAEFIKHVSDNIPGAIFESLYYPDGGSKLLYASEGFEDLWGIPVENVMKEPELRFVPIHNDDKERMLNEIKESLESLTPLNIKFRFVNQKTGNITWIRSKCRASKNEDGTKTLFGLMIDISDTEKYYYELEKSNERYEYVSKAANEGIWDWDLITNKIIIGGNFNEMMKNKEDIKEITFETLQETLHPDDFARVEKKFFEFLADPSQKFWEDTFRLINKEGEIVHVYERGYAIYDELTKKPVRFVGSAFDITQRVKDEEEIKEKANFINHVSNNVPGAIYQMAYYSDGTSKMLYASEGFKELWGMPVDDALIDSEKRFVSVHPDDIERVKQIINYSVKSLTPCDGKYRFVNQMTGKITWVRSKGVPEKMSDGSVVMTGVIIDITETEKYYNELEQSNKRYEYLSIASNETIWDLDLKTMVTKFGGNYMEILGCTFTENQATLEERKKFVHPEDEEQISELILKALENVEKNYWESNFRIISRDGKIKHIFEKGFVLRDETGKAIRAIGSSLDITDKKKSDEAMKEQLEFMKSVSDNVPGGIFEVMFDANNKLTHYYLSESFEKFWGVPVSEIIPDGSQNSRFVHPEDLANFDKIFYSASRYNKLNHKFRFINEKTKEVFWVRMGANILKGNDGSVKIRGVVIDVTDAEKFYHQLEKSNQRYEYVSKAANESIWDLDLKTNEFTFGGSYKEMFGYEYLNDKVNYDVIINMIHPDDKERVLKSIEDIIKHNNKRYWENYYRVIRKGGNVVYVYDRGYVIYDETTNKPVRFVGATQNITQRKLDEESRLEQAKKMEIILEGMNDPFFVIAPNLDVIIMNHAAVNLMGRGNDDIVNMNLKEMYKTAKHQQLFDLIKTTIDAGKSFQEELNINGTWFNVILYPSEIGVALHAKDITDKRKRLEELEKNAKFIKEISDSTPGFLFQLEFDKDLNPSLNYASERAAEYWGIPVKDAIEGKKELFNSIPAEDKIIFKNTLLESVKNLTNLSVKYRLVNKITNDVRWVRAAAIPTKLNNGNVLLNGAVIDITEAETYYSKLDEANQRYEHVSKATNNAIWELDLKTGICIMGGAYENMFGYKLKDDILTDDFHSKMLHPEDIDAVTKSKREALQDKSNRYWERTYRIIRADGEVIHVNDRAYILYDENEEKPIKIIGSTQDITERVKYEAEQKKNEKFLTEISESMQGFIFQTEYDNSYVAKLNYASKNAAEYWGFTVEEVMKDQTKLLDSIHFEDIAEVVNKRLECAKNLINLNIKFRYVNKKTGEIKWVRAMAVPSRLDNGHTIVNGTIVDITETENYYNKLEEATRRYEYLSKATHETIWEMDLKTYEVLLGGGYKEMFGEEYPDNKILFSEWEKYVHPDDLEPVKKSMEAVILDGAKRYWESNYRLIRKDGKTIDVFERAYIVYDEKNNVPLKIIGSTQDITEFNKIQEERDKMFSDLIKRNKALEQFTYMVSHNLRAPIANILGISTLLEENNLDEESRLEMNQLIKKSSSRLDEVIRDMNDILTIRQKFEEDKTEVVFDTILSEIKNIEEHGIQSSGIKIISDFSKVRSIFSVKSFIYSIFQNLVTNSVKYKKDGEPYLKIDSSSDKDYIYLEFEDNGIGIDLEKNKDKIFGLYNRFHLHKEGKGMGLFMVKSQVETMNGEIFVESEVNKGTKFTIKFKK